jgi:2'-5' RNA ligase
MRLFFALRPASGPGDALAALARRIAPVTGGRPVARANLHLTLLFLGELDAGSASAAIDAGAAAALAWRLAVGKAEVDDAMSGDGVVDSREVDDAVSADGVVEIREVDDAVSGDGVVDSREVDARGGDDRVVDARDPNDLAGDAAIRVPLDMLGRFAGARVARVGPAVVPAPLSALHDALRDAARAMAVPFDARPFAPHVTLLRKALRPPPPGALPTPLWLAADRFDLMRSDVGPQGVIDRPFHGWPLGPAPRPSLGGARPRRPAGPAGGSVRGIPLRHVVAVGRDRCRASPAARVGQTTTRCRASAPTTADRAMPSSKVASRPPLATASPSR